MASHSVPYKQDLPPKHGYPAIEYARNLPKRGPSGLVMFLGCTGLMSFGFYCVIQGNIKMRALRKETIEGRIALLPLLQAERDREQLRTLKENYELEALIMKDVKGWNVGESVYHNKRWVPPTTEQLQKL
eukprot:gene9773-10773_t